MVGKLLGVAASEAREITIIDVQLNNDLEFSVAPMIEDQLVGITQTMYLTNKPVANDSTSKIYGDFSALSTTGSIGERIVTALLGIIGLREV